MSKFGRIYASLATIVVIVLFLLLVFLRDIPSEALVAFIGVLVGSLISGFVQFAMSEASMRQQLRLAALDKRLQTAQEAYTLWRRLRRLPHPGEPDDGTPVEDTLRNCRDWWETHSLFLTAEARKAFWKALNAAMELAALRSSHSDWKDLKMAYKDIEEAGKIIEESIFLPSIGELDSTRPEKRPH